MVTNILKDGKVLSDLTGHPVRVDDVQAVYGLIDQIDINIFKEGQIND